MSNQPPKKGAAGRSSAAPQGSLIRPFDPREISAYANIEQLQMMLHAAELNYINRKFPEATRQLFWIQSATTPALKADPWGFPTALSSLPTGFSSKVDARGLQNRTQILLSQMSAGLDYFGYSPQEVPLLGYDAYATLLKQLLADGLQIETAYIAAAGALKLNQNATVPASDLITNKAHELSTLTALSTRITGDIKVTNNDLLDLQDHLIGLRTSLIGAEAAFKQAVANLSGGCPLDEILIFASCVVACATGVGAVVAGITAAASAAGAVSSLASAAVAFSNFAQLEKSIVQTVTVVADDIDKIKKAYNTVKASVQDLTDNSIKLAMDEKSLDAELEKYSSLQEAAVYKQLLHSYVETAKERNQKAITLTSYVAHLAQLSTDIQTSQASIQQQRQTIASNTPVDAQDMLAYLTHSVSSTKYTIIKELDRLRRSLEFWTAEPQEAVYSDKSIVELQALYTSWLATIVDAQENMRRPPQTFDETIGIGITFTRKKDTALFKHFDQSGSILFRLRIDDPKLSKFWNTMRCARAQTFSLAFTGLPAGVDSLKGNLDQMGRSEIMNTEGDVIVFTHPIRPTVFERHIKTGAWGIPANINLPISIYADVAVCGLWRLTVDTLTPAQRNSLTSVTISFGGTFLPIAAAH